MLRVVVDPNVIVSAAITPEGATGRLISLGLAGRFQMIVCPMLLAEAREALSRPKLRRFVELDAAIELLADIEFACESRADPSVIQGATRDPGDDYLVALARESSADRLVSGDADLLELGVGDVRVVRPRQLLDELTEHD